MFAPGPSGFDDFRQTLGLPPLEPFQADIVQTIHGEDPETLVMLPKGAGKTSLMAELAVHHLLSVERPAIYVGAASVAQANLLREIAADLADHGAIRKALRVTRLEVRRGDGGGRLRMVPSDGPKSQGISYSLAICDELHAHRDGALYDSLRSALHKRPDARLVTISTADTGAERPLSKLRERALQAPNVERVGGLTRCSGDDLAALLWEVDRDASLDDMKAILAANPASWIDERAIRLQRKGLPDGEFARLICNMPNTLPVGSWLPHGVWAEAIGKPEFVDGEPIWVGVDVGSERSLTACVWISGPREDGRRHVGCEFWHGEEGVRHALEKVRALASRYTVKEAIADPWHWDLADLELRRHGVISAKFPQTDVRMCPASQALRDAIVDRTIVLPDDPTLTRHAASAIVRHTRRGWRIERASRSPDHAVDGLVALAMALSRAARPIRQARRLGYLAIGG